MDPSILLYLFGSKSELVGESLRLFLDPAALVAAIADGGTQDLGTRLASNLIGTATLRYVMRVGPLVELPVEDVVRLVAPSVQGYLSADATELGLLVAYRP